ncbi:MAG: hypothetical protein PHP85_13345 [Gallionella sp.]|nr:hypothetical protein [Gallionella sp.]
MKSGLVMLFFLAVTGVALAEETHIKARLSAVALYEVPQGWAEEFSMNQGDPQSVISRELHEIHVRLSGGKASRYQTAGDFLTGFEARSMGEPPEKIGFVVVSGKRSPLYRRSVPVSLPPPDTAETARFGAEEFCLVSAGKMFLVLSYSYGDSIPDPDYDGHEVWRKFLTDFRVSR